MADSNVDSNTMEFMRKFQQDVKDCLEGVKEKPLKEMDNPKLVNVLDASRKIMEHVLNFEKMSEEFWNQISKPLKFKKMTDPTSLERMLKFKRDVRDCLEEIKQKPLDEMDKHKLVNVLGTSRKIIEHVLKIVSFEMKL